VVRRFLPRKHLNAATLFQQRLKHKLLDLLLSSRSDKLLFYPQPQLSNHAKLFIDGSQYTPHE
jgi:hypothetical protein